MAKFCRNKDIKAQSRAFLRKFLDLSSRHKEKLRAKAGEISYIHKIHSISTFEKYSNSLTQLGRWCQQNFDVNSISDITEEMGQLYLEIQAYEGGRKGIGKSQKQLNIDYKIMHNYLGFRSLERVIGLKNPGNTRAYTFEQALKISEHQQHKNSLATRIAMNSGTRASELLTLRRTDEASPSGHRAKDWVTERFAGLTGVRYIVTGKGGLKREIMIPRDLSIELEEYRLLTPKIIKSGEAIYHSVYEVGGGDNFSKSFSSASMRAFGWSNGAHGLRHNYAQQRMWTLQKLGYSYHQSRLIVSQELGHFRADIVEIYLR